MEIETHTRIPQTSEGAEAPSFDFLAYSVWGLFGLMVFSGAFLAVHYIPVFGQAFSSVERLNGEVPFGWMVRRIHGAGGSLLLLLFMIHLLRVFYAGSYKRRPGVAWLLEVLCVFSALWINFTGSFLPLSQAAYWGTNTILSNLSSLPWVGGFLAVFFRGGKEMGGTALVRFYGMHIGFSTLIGPLPFPPLSDGNEDGDGSGGLAPFRSFVSPGRGGCPSSRHHVCTRLVCGLPQGGGQPHPQSGTDLLPLVPSLRAGDASSDERTYPFLSLILPVAILLLLFLLPRIDRNPEQGLLRRPFAMALCAAFLVSWIYFSLIGSANAHYGERVIVPDRSLSAAELRGAEVFAEKNCAYCHQVAGREGRRQGPDMTGVRRAGTLPGLDPAVRLQCQALPVRHRHAAV